MKKQSLKWPGFLLLLLLVSLVSWQSRPVPDNYKKLWSQVQHYSKKDLPRSALNVIDKIYAKAKADGNEAQLVKSLLYRMSMESRFKENFRLNDIRMLRKELKTASPVEKHLLYSLLGQLCQGYYDSRLGKILGRETPALSDTALETLDARQWQQLTAKAYLASITGAGVLTKIPLKDFSPILRKSDSGAYQRLPTLYDLMALRAIAYFSSAGAPTRPPSPALSPDTGLLAPAPVFLRERFSGDTVSAMARVLRLFQHVMLLHRERGDDVAFIDADLRRLAWVSRQLPATFAHQLAYSHTLERLLRKHARQPVSVRIAWQLAQVYRGLGRFSSAHVNYLKKAETVCRNVLKAFPEAPFSAQCKNMIARINRPEFSFQTLQALLPGKPFLSYVNVKDCPALWFKVVRVPSDIRNRMADLEMRTLMKQFLARPAVQRWKQEFPFPADHRKHTAEIRLPALPKGSYVIFVSSGPQFSKKFTVLYRQVQVTQMALLSQKDNQKQVQQLYLLHRDTGYPVPGATIKLFARYYDRRWQGQRQVLVGTYTTDASGKTEIPFQNNNRYGSYRIEAVNNGDTTVAGGYALLQGFLYEPRPYEKTYFFTDRAIYRPGQTVFFKAILVSQKGNRAHVVPQKKLVVNLRNARYKKLDQLQLVTDSSGSVSGSFVLPDEALNGRFLLQSSTGSKGILMENYKRPAFFVAFDTLKKAFVLNGNVTLMGKVAYYFGAPADSIPVKFTVERESYFPYPVSGWVPFRPSRVQVAGGKVFTRHDGRFKVSFKALTDPAIPAKARPVYRYVVHVEATDASGETHSASRDIRLSKLSVILNINMPDNVVKEQDQGVEITTRNLSGNGVPAKVEVSLFRLSPPKDYLLPKLWPVPDTVLINPGEFRKDFPHQPWMYEGDKNHMPKTKVASLILMVKGKTMVFSSRLSALKPGSYLVTAQVEGQTGNPVRKFFTVSSIRAKKLPLQTVFWHSLSETTASPGDVLLLNTGSARHNMHILYELLNGTQVVQQRWLVTGKKPVKVEIPVTEAFRGNFFVRLTAVADNRFFTWSQTVKVPFNNKKLRIGLATRRNFLKPGGKETWTVTVSNYSGIPQKAFVLAGMYDASLDVYAPNRWELFPYRSKVAGPSWRSYLFGAGYDRTLFFAPEKIFRETRLSYPGVNWFGYPIHAGGQGIFSVAVATPATMQNNRVAATLGKEKTKRSPEQVKVSLPSEKATSPRPPLRTDFHATAFFYPDLTTGKSGKVSFSFQVPDALTQWKFMALAFTKDMKTGRMEQKFAARKALMVLPNLPRFVRRGDTLVFAARVSNLTNKAIPVTVRVMFFNPGNDRKLSILLSPQAERRLTLNPGENKVVTWGIRIPGNINFLSYRITAVSGKNSDGEERMVPVLANRQLVTESMPMFVKGGQQKQFTFKRMLNDHSPTRKNFRYTLTFTSHPAWYAVQALPYLDKPEYESATTLFYRFYARALAAKLLQTYPRIQKVFEMWKKQSPDAFLSALQKNSELKNIVLQATPWLLEARSETEQKRRVALFFNLNDMQHRQQSALARLQAAQLPSGAWPWFPGMPADFYATQNILSGLAGLYRYKAINLQKYPQLKVMLDKGLLYTDRQMENEYARLLKRYPKTLDKNHLTARIVRYCYLRSSLLDVKPADERTQKAMDYFKEQIRRYWPGLNNDLQALSAMALNRMGRSYDAEAIIRALNEKSLLTPQGGMFWRNDQPFAGQNAISTEVDIMKAFAEVMKDNKSVEQMKTWLILQKQANRWPGNKATADAVYALLMTGSPMLNETRPVEISVGNRPAFPLAGLKLQPGTGYLTKIWTGKTITPGLAVVTVKNPNNAMAYGAAYWQYFEDLNNVKRQAAEVSIKKTLFREVVTAKGKQWVALSKDEPLKTGERIMVRLLVRSARGVDFIQVSDMHAAAFEPAVLLSSYRYRGGLSYYEEVKDAVTRFFIRHLPKGTFMLEYPLLVTQKGSFSDGIARIQSLYLPSFAAHSSGRKIKVQ